MKTIYSVSKTGKTTQWKAELNPNPNGDGFIEIHVKSGYTDGKNIENIRYVKSGKNIGRSNETTLLEQAELELQRLYQDKYDKGYKDNIENVSIEKKVDGISKPMLAAKYPDKAHKLPEKLFDIALQPKVDGLRCFVQRMEDDSIRFTSRSGKVFSPIPHIALEALKHLSKGDILDGELYIPNTDLQDIMSVVSPSKNIKTELQKEVKLYWYDFIPLGKENESFQTRFIDCELYFEDPIVKLETLTFKSDEFKDVLITEDTFLTILEDTFDNYIENGYEGLMIRNTSSPYYFGRRHDSLQKYKKMFTDEFQIIDILESDNDDAPRFVCDLRNGNTVTVRLKGDKELNLEYLENKSKYINKWLTIKYQTETKTGSLQFPVGVSLRDGDVIDGTFVPFL